MRFTVVCSVRNEGAFLVEWVAWYRRLGFTDLVIATNDCTDATPALLEAMQAAGLVTHLPVTIPPGGPITATKLAAAKGLPQVAGADWLLVCDVDEFLVIQKGAGRVTDLIPEKADFLGMAINWRVFGNAGQAQFEDGLVHRRFTRAALPDDPTGTWVKTIHAQPGWFRKLGEHGPKRLLPRHAARWGTPGMRWVDSSGQTLDDWHPEGDYLRRMTPGRQRHAAAQMNHYMIRDAETFGLKRGTLSPVAGKNRYTDSYFDRYNRNEAEDRSALAHAAEFDREHAALMAVPGLAALHHRACADHLARIAAKAGLRAEDDPRFLWHRDRC